MSNDTTVLMNYSHEYLMNSCAIACQFAIGTFTNISLPSTHLLLPHSHMHTHVHILGTHSCGCVSVATFHIQEEISPWPLLQLLKPVQDAQHSLCSCSLCSCSPSWQLESLTLKNTHCHKLHTLPCVYLRTLYYCKSSLLLVLLYAVCMHVCISLL